MIKNIYMPDIGNCNNIVVTDIFVSKDDGIKKNTNIIRVEVDKTVIDIPSPYTGTINEIKLSIGDIIKKDHIILNVKILNDEHKIHLNNNVIDNRDKINIHDKLTIYASPNIRRLAKQFNIDLKEISGTGKNNKITYNDITKNITNVVEKKDIKSNNVLSISWQKIPHVTQFAELDISNILNIYKNKKIELKKNKIKLTLLPFIIKAVATTLKTYPYFNASINDLNQIIIKKYYNIGIIISTKNGLKIPIIKNTDKKNITEINSDLILYKEKAQNNDISPHDIAGGSFSISNLGMNISGFFTPIIKYPESAILGISKYNLKSILSETGKITFKTVLPISLSYDHRLINGLDAANFIKCFHSNLNNIKSIHR